MSIQERKKNPSAFLRNIFQILQNTEVNDVIEWAPQGNGFIIKDLPKFQATILPQYFKHKKYSSFVRQRLPTDIKRKPQKKKKGGDQLSSGQMRDGNWFTFSQELRQHFPHIAENILVRSDGERKKNILLSSGKNSIEQLLSPSKVMEQQEESQSEEYVSKISLKGLMEEIDGTSQIMRQKYASEGIISGKINSDRGDSSCENDEIIKSIKDQCESEMNESSDKRSFSRLKFKREPREQAKFLNSEFDQTKETFQKMNQLSTISFSMLESTLQSLSGLSEVIARQNELLVKTHPLIRNVVLKSQKNKMTFLNQQINIFENSENSLNSILQNSGNKEIQKILDCQKEEIIELTDILQQQVQGLSEFIVCEEDLPISATSIRGRLERME